VDTLKVRDAKDVEEVVRAAIANEQPLEIIGHGSKRGIGHAMATNAVLDVSALNAITGYEPNELIVTLQAGAPLADVLSLIRAGSRRAARATICSGRMPSPVSATASRPAARW
jgi:glycolate oxidase FAD binding subunit